MKYIFNGDTQTMMRMRKIFMRIAKECDIEIGRVKVTVFLSKLVEALIKEGVFTKVEGDDTDEATE